MRRALSAAAALALCLSVAGCTDDDGSPTSTTSSPPSTGSSTDPTDTTPTTTGTADEPPVLPDAAKQKTTAGAKAFVSYFAEVVNYAYGELEAPVLRDVSAADCAVCKLLIRDVRDLVKNGGSQTGGQWSVHSVAPVGHFETSHLLVAEIRVAKGQIQDSSEATPQPIPAATVVDQFKLVWHGKWLVQDVKST